MMNTRKKLISIVLTYYTTQCDIYHSIREILLNQCQRRSTLCYYATTLLHNYTIVALLLSRVVQMKDK